MIRETEYPSFSGISTFMRADIKDRSDIKEGEYAVIGAPYDTTLGTRPGARYAPKSIREESAHYIYHFSAIDKEVIDVCSGVKYKYEPISKLYDTGDARVYPSDVAKTTKSIADEIDKIVSRGGIPVTLGGDHYITYPVMVGFESGMEKQLKRKPRIGYVHIDSHMDAYYENETWGKYYHGSPARRISELESVAIKNMVWVGLNGTTGIEPYNYVKANNGTMFTIDDVNKEGMTAIMKKACEIAGEGCDCIYVTIDIDVVDQAYSAGTGSYVYGGITACQLLEAADAISENKQVKGIDLVEVAPNLDLTGNTARLAATTLISFLKPRLFKKTESGE